MPVYILAVKLPNGETETLMDAYHSLEKAEEGKKRLAAAYLKKGKKDLAESLVIVKDVEK